MRRNYLIRVFVPVVVLMAAYFGFQAPAGADSPEAAAATEVADSTAAAATEAAEGGPVDSEITDEAQAAEAYAEDGLAGEEYADEELGADELGDAEADDEDFSMPEYVRDWEEEQAAAEAEEEAAAAEDTTGRGTKAAVSALDLVIFRPAAIIRLTVGSAIALVSYPASLGTSSSDEVLDAQVLDPFDDAFRRPVGDVDGGLRALGEVAFDGLVLRPVSVVRLGAGAVGTAVAWPASLPSGNGDEVLESFVRTPYDDAFGRPLGEF